MRSPIRLVRGRPPRTGREDRVSSAPRILVLHGPNLNLLGRREPDVYGRTTLAEIDAGLVDVATTAGFEVDCRQSNHEGVLIDAVQDAMGSSAGILINPGGLTHTSVSLRDALAATGLPVVEVHLSNVHCREPFRRHSYVSGVATGVVAGLGAPGYALGLRALMGLIQG